MAEPARISQLQLSINAGLTRLILVSDRPLQGSVTAADSLGLTLRLPEARFEAAPGTALAGGLIARLPMPAAGANELAFDLVDTAVVDRAFQIGPGPQGRLGHRLVIDLLPADPASFAGFFARPVPLPMAEPPAPPAPRNPKRLIVLDPGHGGHDPGAISASGRYEKELTLAVAKTVAEKLTATGRYRVLLTRERDVAVKLGERVKFAREHEAELFLSIHADSLRGDRTMRGASVYTRAERATDRDAEALALRENRADQIADGGSAGADEVDDVVAILLDLASRDTPRLSGRFAGQLAAALGERTPLRRKSLLAANFKVLSAPDVPSALLELGYLSNPAEEAQLYSEAGRRELADAVMRAIDRFFAPAR